MSALEGLARGLAVFCLCMPIAGPIMDLAVQVMMDRVDFAEVSANVSSSRKQVILQPDITSLKNDNRELLAYNTIALVLTVAGLYFGVLGIGVLGIALGCSAILNVGTLLGRMYHWHAITSLESRYTALRTFS